MRWPRRIVIIVALALAWMASGSPGHAHLTPNSEVRLDFGPDRIATDIIIPLGDYALATGNPVTNDPQSLARARAFLMAKIAARSPDGRRWTLAINSIEFAQIAGPPDLHAVAVLTPPPGADARRLTIDWQPVVDTVPGHFALFVAAGDFGSGRLGDTSEVIGAARANSRSVEIDRGTSSLWRGFSAAVGVGMQHIAEGHDHLLFLIALLLPAPLIARNRRWLDTRRPRAAVWKLTKIVSSFTVGHSLTLIGAALFAWRLPAPPVEAMIALSILVSAIHAARPIFPGREEWIAGGFGLIHGLAFATVVQNFGLGMGEKALSIFGFNLGIEVVQLAVVLAIMPSLMILARTPYYRAIRTTGAVIAGVAATAWIVERVTATPNIVADSIDTALGWSPVLVVILTVVAVGLYVSGRTSRPVTV